MRDYTTDDTTDETTVEDYWYARSDNAEVVLMAAKNLFISVTATLVLILLI
jgi:hypothetical protein